MSKEEFDFEKHEQEVAERYRHLAMYDAFDAFVDMAIDGIISVPEALTAFKEEYGVEFQRS